MSDDPPRFRAVGRKSIRPTLVPRDLMADEELAGVWTAQVITLLPQAFPGVLGESLNWTVFLAATALSMTVIYLLSLLCSLYPGWRASRLSPSAALHYE